MKRFNTRFTAYLAALLLLMVPLIGHTQAAPNWYLGHGSPASAGTATDDNVVAMLVKFIGATGVTFNDAQLAIEADSNFTFISGITGTLVANTSLECPVSGALGGVLDVSNAACNTFGEIADMINASGDFLAVLVNARRTEIANARLLAIGTADLTKPEGFQVLYDTTTALSTSATLFPGDMETNMARWLSGPQGPLLANPFRGTWTALYHAHGYSTWNTTSVTEIVSIESNNSEDGGRETVKVLYAVAGGATGTDKDYSPNVMWKGNPHSKVQIRNTCTATMSAQNLYAYGEVYSLTP